MPLSVSGPVNTYSPYPRQNSGRRTRSDEILEARKVSAAPPVPSVP